MRSLAEYIMRGRSQAVIVAVITAGIPMLFWIAASAVGLVTLRRGMKDGGIVCVWAMIPAAVVAVFGEIMPVLAMPGVLMLAWVLRTTLRWSWALLGSTVIAVAFSAGLMSVGEAYLAEITRLFQQVFKDIETAGDSGVALVPPSAPEIAGMFGLVHGVTLVVCLLIARWWQALLFNPGGFGAEFKSLRLEPLQGIGLILSAVALGMIGPEFRLWTWMPLLPLLFAGLGLVHGVVARTGKGGLLGIFYAALIMMPPAKQLLVVLAVMDSWMDFRTRWRKSPANEDGPSSPEE